MQQIGSGMQQIGFKRGSARGGCKGHALQNMELARMLNVVKRENTALEQQVTDLQQMIISLTNDNHNLATALKVFAFPCRH